MNDEMLDSIQREMRGALGDILGAYAVAGRDPADHTVDAFALLFDCSRNEFKKLAAKLSRERGQTLFRGHGSLE